MKSKIKIKINFSDFWPGFDHRENYFTKLLKKEYDLEISENPDYLIYSVFGELYRNYSCTRIFYTGENIRPNLNDCDYSFSFDYQEHSKTNYRLPLYAMDHDLNLLTKEIASVDAIINGKRKFCNMLVSNPSSKKRLRFFQKLSQYKRVDSGGECLNNIGYKVANKREFISEYKFTLAFENSSFPGYTTEKIVDPMEVQSIPIYWGNPLISKDFNTSSFINYHDYKDDDEVIEKIIEIDTDIDLYKEYLSQPFFTNNKVNQYVDKQNVLQQFGTIFSKN